MVGPALMTRERVCKDILYTFAGLEHQTQLCMTLTVTPGLYDTLLPYLVCITLYVPIIFIDLTTKRNIYNMVT